MLAAMANRAAQQISRAGLTPTLNAAASGDTCDVGTTTFLDVRNGSGSAITLTVTAVGGKGGLALANLVVSVPATSEKFIGPIDPELFENVSDGKAHLAWSATTTVTFAVLEM